MTVAELISELQKYPSEFAVHLDMCADEEIGWEGDRVVRNACGTAIQDGFRAVRIDGHSYGDEENARMREQVALV